MDKESTFPLQSHHQEQTYAIRLEGLCKEYVLGSGADHSIKSKIFRKISGKKPDILRVLNGIDLEIQKGQVVGICGANGAGKSTLLKIIAGIIPPSSGTVTVQGRIASLLELGAGFHPEMTGAENVLLNGVILGLPERELKRKMPAIFRTAGLERFTHTPLKNYSTGMIQRLGFSIASHLDPDILILDEIFAVGDILFQYSAWEIFYRFKARNRTILLVSHDLSLLERFCDRVLILANGAILLDGPPKMVTHEYASLSWQHRAQIGDDHVPYATVNRGGNQRMRITHIHLLDSEGREQRAFRQFSPLHLRLTIDNPDSDLGKPFVSVRIKDQWGQGLCQSVLNTPDTFEKTPRVFQLELVYDCLLLYPGCYSLEVLLKSMSGNILDFWGHGESFNVIPPQDTGQFDAIHTGYFVHPARWQESRD